MAYIFRYHGGPGSLALPPKTGLGRRVGNAKNTNKRKNGNGREQRPLCTRPRELDISMNANSLKCQPRFTMYTYRGLIVRAESFYLL